MSQPTPWDDAFLEEAERAEAALARDEAERLAREERALLEAETTWPDSLEEHERRFNEGLAEALARDEAEAIERVEAWR
jgi:protein required for attachment to host cells